MKVSELKELLNDIDGNLEVKLYSEDDSFIDLGLESSEPYYTDVDVDATGLIEIDNEKVFMLTPFGKIIT